MKPQRPWPNPKPSRFRKTPPEIVALEQRQRAAAADLAERRARFFDGVVRGLGGTSLMLIIAVAAIAFWTR